MTEAPNQHQAALPLHGTQEYNQWQRFTGAPMFVTFVLSLFNRSPRFAWRPALDLTDGRVVSTLIPGAQY